MRRSTAKTVHFTSDSTDKEANLNDGYFSSSESSMSEQAMAIFMKKLKLEAKKESKEKEESSKRLNPGKQPQTVT